MKFNLILTIFIFTEGDLGVVISDDINCVSLDVMEELHRLLIEKKCELDKKIAEFDSKLLSNTAVAG